MKDTNDENAVVLRNIEECMAAAAVLPQDQTVSRRVEPAGPGKVGRNPRRLTNLFDVGVRLFFAKLPIAVLVDVIDISTRKQR
jgi:hypothetical protein